MKQTCYNSASIETAVIYKELNKEEAHECYAIVGDNHVKTRVTNRQKCRHILELSSHIITKHDVSMLYFTNKDDWYRKWSINQNFFHQILYFDQDQKI